MSDKPLTFGYKALQHDIGKTHIELDVWLPQSSSSGKELPVLVWFHGGGGFCGDKGEHNLWFPYWVKDLATKRNNWIFVSANYRLLVPTNGHHILEDIKDTFRFVASELGPKIASLGFKINLDRLAVGGESFGGYCARLAALHAEPKPKVILSMYGMGGLLLASFYTQGRQKDGPFPTPFHQPLLPVPDPANEDILSPDNQTTVTSTPMGMDAEGNSLHPRMGPFIYTCQLGNFLDYLTGEQGFTASIKEKVEEGDKISKEDVPSSMHEVFPEFDVSRLPPSVLVHGLADTCVSYKESRETGTQLTKVGTETLLVELENEEHGFDILAGAAAVDGDVTWEKMRGREVEEFLRKYLV